MLIILRISFSVFLLIRQFNGYVLLSPLLSLTFSCSVCAMMMLGDILGIPVAFND